MTLRASRQILIWIAVLCGPVYRLSQDSRHDKGPASYEWTRVFCFACVRYNFSCMEMEPMFERERQEMKARQLHQASRVSCWKSIKSYVLKAGGKRSGKGE